MELGLERWLATINNYNFRDLIPSDLHGHRAFTWCTYIQAGQVRMHKRNEIHLF